MLLAVVIVFSSQTRNSALTLQSIMALPLLGVSMPADWGSRWAANRYLDIQRDPEPESRRKRLTKRVLTLLLIGLVPGILRRMDLPSEQAIGKLHGLLQAALQDHFGWAM